MAKEEIEKPESPVAVVRSAAETAADEIFRWGEKLNEPELARQHALADKPDVEAFRKAVAEKDKATSTRAAEAMGPNAGVIGFEQDGSVVVDRAKREVIDAIGTGLTERQMAAISTKSYRDAFRDYLRHKGLSNLGADARRSLSEGVDSEGGFLVPAEFMAKMVERLGAATALQSLVTGLTTSSDKLILPKNTYSGSSLYTTGVRVNWVAEKSGPSSEEDATDFGNIEIPVHTAMMYHDVTNNMIEDSAFDILGWLTSKFRETSDIVTEDMILNGTGIGKPRGILANPNGTDEPATVVSGSGTTLTADGIMDIAYSLLARYKPNARFIFNSTSGGKTIAKLKDGDLRYLFASGVTNDGLATARPSTLVGYPITESDFMPDVAASAYPIIFGDPTGYYLVRRIGFSVQVLNEIVATANKVRVLGRMRIGGQVGEDWRLKIQTVST